MRIEKSTKIVIVGLTMVIVVISLWVLFSKPADEYAYGGHKLTDSQYKDLMT